MKIYMTAAFLLAISTGCCLEHNVPKVIVDGTGNAVSSFSGACTFTQSISLFMAENGFNVTIITNKYDKQFVMPGIDHKTKVVEVKRFNLRETRYFYVLRDMIYRFLSGLHVAIFARDADIYITDSPFAVVPIKVLTNMKCLLYIHFPNTRKTNRGLKKIYNTLMNYMIYQGLRFSDVVAFNSHWTKNYSETNFPRWSQIKSEVIHPYFILEDSHKSIESRLRFIDKDSQFNFVSVNRLNPQKKFEVLIEAMSILKDNLSEFMFEKVKLKIIGASNLIDPGTRNYIPKLEKMAIELGLTSNIEFIVNPTHSEKESLLAESHTLLYSSINEHFGISICDGFLHSLPVIASNSGGPLEIIDHGSNGFLAEPTGAGFAKYMRMLIEDTDRAELMGKKGHETLNERYLQRPRKMLRDLLGQN